MKSRAGFAAERTVVGNIPVLKIVSVRVRDVAVTATGFKAGSVVETKPGKRLRGSTAKVVRGVPALITTSVGNPSNPVKVIRRSSRVIRSKETTPVLPESTNLRTVGGPSRGT